MKPTLEQVKRSLRLTGVDHDDELDELIDRCDAEAKTFIDQPVFETQEALDASTVGGVLINASYTQAVVLLVRYYFDDLGGQHSEQTQTAAYNLLRPFRLAGV